MGGHQNQITSEALGRVHDGAMRQVARYPFALGRNSRQRCGQARLVENPVRFLMTGCDQQLHGLHIEPLAQAYQGNRRVRHHVQEGDASPQRRRQVHGMVDRPAGQLRSITGHQQMGVRHQKHRGSLLSTHAGRISR